MSGQAASSLAAFTRAGVSDFARSGKKRIEEGGKGSGIIGHTTDKLKRAEKAMNRATNAADDRPSPKNETKMQKARQEYAKAAADHADALGAELEKAKADYEAKYGKKYESGSLEESGGKPSLFEVGLITEGLGNFADRYYYPADALKEAAHLFEGAKIFEDHETDKEAAEKPERSIGDIRGHFDDVEAKTLGAGDGRTVLGANAVIPAGQSFDQARELMAHAVEYAKKHPGKEFIGLSINAHGSAIERDIDDVIAEAPAGAIPKLQEAKAQGITKVKYVTKLTAADSCDLVTQAGAGGRVVKMIEGNKHGPKWTGCVHKVQKKQGGDEPYNPYAVCTTSVGSQKENEMAKKTGTQVAGHADAEQDKALMKKMLKDHLGKDEPTQEEMDAAHEAYGEATKMFPDNKEEAMKCAGYSMKMASHRQAEAAKAAEAAAAAPAAGSDPGADEGDAEDEDKKKEAAAAKEAADKEEAAKKEAAKAATAGKDDSVKLKEAEASNLKLAGENASLKARIRKTDLQEYMDKQLKESKLPNFATKLFREKLGEPKSEKELDEKLAIFVEAWSAGGTPSTELLIEAEREIPGSSTESETSLAEAIN